MSRPNKLLIALAGVIGLYLLSRTGSGQMIAANVADKIGKLLTGEEGERLSVYQDTGGAWTIGKGHLIKPGERFFPYGGSILALNSGVRTINKAESDALFASDTKIARDAVAYSVKVPLTENQFAALVSLVFNIGVGAFTQSTLLKRLNARDYAGASKEFDRWVYDNGKINSRLVTRREREQTLFNA